MRLSYAFTGCVVFLGAATVATAADGRKIYESVCAGCHDTGLIGSPKLGVVADWATRLQKGRSAIYGNALRGTARGMPPKGGKPELSDNDVRAAVDYMVMRAGGMPKTAAIARDTAVQKSVKEKVPPKPNSTAAAQTPAVSNESAPIPKPPSVAVIPPTSRVPIIDTDSNDVNAFNRLLRPPGKRNLPPTQDGIHDPANDGTQALQPPTLSFRSLPPANSGNRVDWVAALNSAKINPRWDRNNPDAQPLVMDLNIVREVKGSMPDVVYPHKQHTQWLDCANCHPSLFVPQKGANQISMAAILLGQKCGVCHGKVAFPVSECRLCHSRKKDGGAATAAAGGKP